MENSDIIFLTCIICTLFIVFIIGLLLYAHRITENKINPKKNDDKSFMSKGRFFWF
jgi:hypothetical protein